MATKICSRENLPSKPTALVLLVLSEEVGKRVLLFICGLWRPPVHRTSTLTGFRGVRRIRSLGHHRVPTHHPGTATTQQVKAPRASLSGRAAVQGVQAKVGGSRSRSRASPDAESGEQVGRRRSRGGGRRSIEAHEKIHVGPRRRRSWRRRSRRRRSATGPRERSRSAPRRPSSQKTPGRAPHPRASRRRRPAPRRPRRPRRRPPPRTTWRPR